MASSALHFATSLRTLLSSSPVRRFHRTPSYSSLVLQPAALKTLVRSPDFRGVSVVGKKSGGIGWRRKASVAGAEMAAEKGEGKKVNVFDSEEDLAVAVAKYTADLADKFSKTRGSFTVVLSGGSLIKSLRSKAFIYFSFLFRLFVSN